ncbi:MAG: carbohydrate-binding protein, partial [Myxococcota bacterium]
SGGSGGPTTYEAEAATLTGALVFSGRGASGGQYVDYQNPTQDAVEWSVTVPSAGTYQVTVEYQNGSPASRPLALDVNGVRAASVVDFPPTGSWATWTRTGFTVSLASGANQLRLVADGSSGPNIDFITVQ